ncbi:MAG: SPFH domain-containing protein [Candidatus Woesearchaeota archaeon]
MDRKIRSNHYNKPGFETIYWVYQVPSGYKGVLRRFGEIIEVVNAGLVRGLPVVNDIALVPEAPSQINNLECIVRSSDNRQITIKSDTYVVINKPDEFMKRAPDDYLNMLIPRIEQTIQETIAGHYESSELAEKNEEISDKIVKRINASSNCVSWGLMIQSFTYTSSFDQADILRGVAFKQRKADLLDTRANGKVNIARTEIEGKVNLIATRYGVQAEVFAIREEGMAIADVGKYKGMAELDVLQRKLEVYAGYTEKVLGILARVRTGLNDTDGELFFAYLLAPLGRMLGGEFQSAGEPDKDITSAMVSRIRSRLQGEGIGRYLDGSSREGVSPYATLIAKVLPEVVDGLGGILRKK